MPPGLRKVKYINAVNNTKVAEMIKTVVQFPPKTVLSLREEGWIVRIKGRSSGEGYPTVRWWTGAA